MAIVTYDPFRSIRVLQNEINRLFDRDLDDNAGMTADWAMRVDIKEEKNALLIRADLPGMEQKDIKVHVEDNRLTIQGERRLEKEEKREDFHRIERSYGTFSRTFQLPATVDVERINATYRNGVLEVSLPKHERAKPKSIEVAVAE